ncbi:MAG: large subunit ribosomal protein L9 [Parcubacteria group bacterium Gr01-1014_106]|nr:MAG: large subunit ribosomal protein L9 [Parcubacteria group bacterium Gr01-1014_106]
MKVLLLGRVEGLGEAGDIVDADDAFVRDVLFPQELAVVATGSQSAQTSPSAIPEEELAAAQRVADLTDQKTVRIERPVNAERNLEKPLTARDLQSAIEQEIGASLPADAVRLPHPITEPGQYTVSLEFPHGLEAEIKLIVEPGNESK